METQDFEKKLTQMTKPEISHLKHQDILADAIVKAKDKSVLSWWWLSVPLYIIAAFLMKSFYMPQATLISSVHEFAGKEKFLSVLFFIITPIVFIILNSISIQKIYKMQGHSKATEFVQATWFNFLMIIFSILILLIYSL